VVPPALLVLRQPQVLLLLLEVVLLLRVMQPHSLQAAAQDCPYGAGRVA
jgi:hypothetical protein